MQKPLNSLHGINSKKLIINELHSPKKYQQSIIICSHCSNQIPIRLMKSHQNVCMASSVGPIALGREMEGSRKSLKAGDAQNGQQLNKYKKYRILTKDKIANLKQNNRFKDQQQLNKDRQMPQFQTFSPKHQNLSSNHQKFQKFISSNNLQNKMSHKKILRNNKQFLLQPKQDYYYNNNNNYNNDNNYYKNNINIFSHEDKQYDNHRKNMSQIKKQIKNNQLKKSYKNNFKNIQQLQKNKQIQRKQKQRLKKIQHETQKLKKQKQKILKQLKQQKQQKQKKQERQHKKTNVRSSSKKKQSVNHNRPKTRNEPQIPKPRIQQQRNDTNRNHHQRPPHRPQTIHQSYHEQIPFPNPHYPFNIFSSTMNHQFQMMKQQFQHMNQLFSNFIPFPHSHFVFFQNRSGSDSSIDSSSAQQEQINRQGLSPQQIEQFPQSFYSKKPSLDQQCSVCISVIQHKQIIRRLPCNHIFHSQCIDQWLKKKGICPICRINIHHFCI